MVWIARHCICSNHSNNPWTTQAGPSGWPRESTPTGCLIFCDAKNKKKPSTCSKAGSKAAKNVFIFISFLENKYFIRIGSAAQNQTCWLILKEKSLYFYLDLLLTTLLCISFLLKVDESHNALLFVTIFIMKRILPERTFTYDIRFFDKFGKQARLCSQIRSIRITLD